MTDPLNILLISCGIPGKDPEVPPLESMRRARQIFYLARGLDQQKNLNVTLLCPEQAELFRWSSECGLETIPLKQGFLPNLLFRKKLAGQLSARPGKWILHSQDNAAARYASGLLPLLPKTAHIISRRATSHIVGKSLQKIYREATAVACETQEIAYLCAEAKIAPQKLKILHPGLDPADCPPKVRRNDNRLIFCYCADLTEDNGQLMLIEGMAAFSLLANRHNIHNWEVRIFGDGPLFEEVLRRAMELGMEKHLILMTMRDPMPMLPYTDIALATARTGDGCSSFIMTAWGSGLPVVCSDLLAHKELARDQQDALFYEAEAPSALAGKMLDLALSEELRHKLASKGKSSLHEHSDAKMTSACLELYRELGY